MEMRQINYLALQPGKEVLSLDCSWNFHKTEAFFSSLSNQELAWSAIAAENSVQYFCITTRLWFGVLQTDKLHSVQERIPTNYKHLLSFHFQLILQNITACKTGLPVIETPSNLTHKFIHIVKNKNKRWFLHTIFSWKRIVRVIK